MGDGNFDTNSHLRENNLRCQKNHFYLSYANRTPDPSPSRPLAMLANKLLTRIARTQITHLHQLIRSRTMATTRIGTEDPRMSKIVIHNGIVYISGQTDGTTTDIKNQTANVLKKVDDLLAQANTDKSKLLTSSIWLKDISRDFKDMNDVWNGWVDPNNKPVRATVEANMAREQLLIEVQVTAATE
eukprot:scaffold831_cov139-Skeletonema_dohrnii-CCMP3373.AAC.5